MFRIPQRDHGADDSETGASGDSVAPLRAREQAQRPVRSMREVVELCRRYSNRDDLLKPLAAVLGRIEAGDQADEPAMTLDRSSPEFQALLERLSPSNLDSIAHVYLAGMPAQELANLLGMSLSKLTKLLHQHGIRRS